MKRIKRNKTIEKGILFAAILPQMDGRTAGEVMDATAEAYKEYEAVKIFTAEETDAIMQALKSMPGYTPERLLAAGAPMTRDISNPHECFEWQLYNVYIMLSITNPELFEDKEEEEDGKTDSEG